MTFVIEPQTNHVTCVSMFGHLFNKICCLTGSENSDFLFQSNQTQKLTDLIMNNLTNDSRLDNTLFLF